MVSDVTPAELSRAQQEIAAIQALYDATTHLQAVLAFTHDTADLLKPEMDYACRRLMVARAMVRRLQIVTHVDAGLLEQIEIPEAFRSSSRRDGRRIRS